MTESPQRMQIARRSIGPGELAFVIAEAGVNHNGDPALAHALIDAAAGAGADAVKFQTFRAERVVTPTAATAEYQAASGEGDQQLAMLQRLELPLELWHELRDHAGASGLIFLSTAFDLESLELLESLGVDAVKIPSGELDNLAFLDAHVATGRPLIVSTGMADQAEVDRAVSVLAGGSAGYSLLHCVTAYPTPLGASNLAVIPNMQARYNVPVGWSDHTSGWLTAVAARSLGASIFEKHLTLDRSMEGPDHQASEDPKGFAEYVRAIRETEEALGDGIKRPHEIELPTRVLVRRSYYAARDLEAGHTLETDDLRLLRPVEGVPVSERIAGESLSRAVAAGEPIRRSDLA